MVEQGAGAGGGPSVIERFRKGEVPRQGRLAAAQGALPLPPEQLLTVLFILRKDPDEEIRAAVLETVKGLGDPSLQQFLGRRDVHPAILDFYARVLQGRDEVLNTLLTNPSTHDKTVAYLAERVSPDLQSVIVLNQVRLERHPAIADALRRNPNLEHSVRRRLEEVEEILPRRKPEEEAPKEEPASEEAADDAAEDEEPAAAEEEGEAEVDEALAEAAEAAESDAAEDEDRDDPLLAALDALESDVLDDDAADELEEAIDEELAQEGDLQSRLRDMSVNDKVKLARSGPAKARALLVRDPVKVVREAVLDSPKLTEQEVEAFASNRATNEEILRKIGSNRDWIKNYTIMHRLLTNPKSPVGVTMRFLPRLTDKDLKDLSKNRNIPAALRTVAARRYQEKTKPKKTFKKH